MLLTAVVLLSAVLGLAYLYLQKCWSFWKGQGLPQIDPKSILGSMPFFITKSSPLDEGLIQIWEESKGAPVVGCYLMNHPLLMIQDPEIAKEVMVKQFSSFHDRQSPAMMDRWEYCQTWGDRVIARQMTMAPGELWKNLRTTFTPIFSTGKMKAMMVFINETGNRLITTMDKLAESGEDFETKHVLGKFSMDTIASCAFGVDAKVHETEDSIFVKYASELFKQTPIQMMKFMMINIPFGPTILKTFNMNVFPEKPTKFFYDVVLQTINSRKEAKSRRNDLVDMMIDAVKGDLDQNENETDQFYKDAKLDHKVTKKLSEFEIVSTALVILIAGYDTTANTLSYVCYELAKNPEIQERLREEVDDIIDDDCKNIKYEQLQKMPYMDMVLAETLRFHTPIGVHQRTSMVDYTLTVGGKQFKIPKHTDTWINAQAMHFNPQYWANPNTFDPEHFSDEAKASRHPYAWMPFGQGPHNCIGMRFAMLEAKLAMARILKNYVLKPSPKTQEPIRCDPIYAVSYIKGGLHIKIEKRY